MGRIHLDDIEERGVWRHLPLSDAKLEKFATNVRAYYKGKRGSKNLIIFDDNVLCLWDNQDQRLVCLAIQDDKVKGLQYLCPTNPPVFDIDWLLLSPDSRHLALLGTHGILIVQMPRKWGPHGLYESGTSSCLCRSFPVAERFFICNQKISLLEARFHPGSPTHIAALTDDDCIRIYDINSSQVCFQEIRLSTSLHCDLGFTKYAAPLGHIAVSFDFGPPLPKSRWTGKDRITAITSRPIAPSSLPETTQSARSLTDDESYVWPIYVLRSNGDVILVYNDLDNVYTSRKILGPLTMRPPAEDNYGVDASSLICLDSNPPLIVIATSSMMLYHCLAIDINTKTGNNNYTVVTNDNARNNNLQNDDGDPSDISSYRNEVVFTHETCGTDLVTAASVTGHGESSGNFCSINEPTLFVLESLELILSLTSIVDQDLLSPVRLHKSSASPQVYSCCHEAGIHIVNVPFLTQLSLGNPLSDDFEPSITEYLVCTKPISSSSIPASIPLGIATLPRREHFLVAVLLSSGEILTQKMTSIYLTSLSYIDDPTEELKIDPSVNFSVYINQILKRNMNAPLMKSEPEEDADKQGMLCVLMNATDIIRKEYLVRMEKASEIMAKRVRSLVSSKEFQLEEIKRLELEKDSIVEEAERLSKRYNSTFSRQEELSKKVEKVLETLQNRLNHLSDAEAACKGELEEINRSIIMYRNRLDQIKTKIKFQQAIRQNNLTETRGKLHYVNSRIQFIRSELSNQSKAIEQLVAQLNSLKS